MAAASKDNVEKQREIERQLEEARRREAKVKAARERAAAELRKKQQEEEEQRRKALEIQRKLDRIGRCIAGFKWRRQADEYRCTGGSHFVSLRDWYVTVALYRCQKVSRPHDLAA